MGRTSLNRVFLIGNLTRDPELRYTPSGQAVTNFSIAVNRVYKDREGQSKEAVDFIRIVTWGRQAELSNEYLSKGRLVLVEGGLQQRSWETPDGEKRSTIEVRANRVQFLPGGQPREVDPVRDSKEPLSLKGASNGVEGVSKGPADKETENEGVPF